MNRLSLSGRLAACADKVREGSRLADIGTDHGYLPVYLAQSRRVLSAVACDIAQGPLNAACENIGKHGLEDVVSTRLTDGLNGITRGDADDIVIAGMGGELIASILDQADFIRDPSVLLILQPMTRYEKLLRYLYQNGFELLSQEAVSEKDKTYTVITARYSGENTDVTPLSVYVGKLDKNDPEDRKFLHNTLDRLKKQSLGDENARLAAEQLKEYLL